ncbi:MAG: serine/threonine-protein kinase [Maioricimonas sp. JB049]
MIQAVLQNLMNEIVATLLVTSGVSLFEQFKRILHRRAVQAPARKLHELLDAFGQLGPRQIDRLIAEAEHHNGRRFPDGPRQELLDLMRNLARGAQLLTSQGKPTSAYLRSERLLEQLLLDLQPVRRRGEPAGIGHSEWVLDRFLGRGAYGEVWSATMTGSNWQRAFKFFTQPEAREWLHREQDNLMALKKALPREHPNIMPLHGVSIDDQEYPFFQFEYASGGSLEEWILEDPDVRMPLEKSNILLGIVEGLAATHEKGIFHRDIKPANIVLSEGPDPIPKLTDFGLATCDLAARGGSSSEQTAALFAGTSMYLPPEAKCPFAEADPALQDIFAVGVVWYQLCVERIEQPPYSFARRLAAHDVDSHTTDLIGRCLAAPEERFPNAMELLEHLLDRVPEPWTVPAGMYDVQYLVREALLPSDPV